jgi:hypothetical protein
MVEIIFLLQQLYAERYGRPAFIDALVKLVEQSGYMGRITPGLNRKREAMGLPPLSTDIAKEIGQLLEGLRKPHSLSGLDDEVGRKPGSPSEAAE